MKYFTAAIATGALGLALVGCGSDNKSSTTSTSTSTSTSATSASGATSLCNQRGAGRAGAQDHR